MDHLIYLATVHPALIISLVVIVGLGLIFGLGAVFNMGSPDRHPSRTPEVIAREDQERAENTAAVLGHVRSGIEERAQARRTGQQSEAKSIH
ncbi:MULTISPECIES: hypothetical protein [Brevibacterium]|jgi:hypothetical protein|uniref:Uncharacterized protein n=1 Tax=Brevibacterium salitolerans TaxID=1403566 RepID=A0ABN2X9S5_9MICO|nr:hypothetical protein [Brevibacterium sp.]